MPHQRKFFSPQRRRERGVSDGNEGKEGRDREQGKSEATRPQGAGSGGRACRFSASTVLALLVLLALVLAACGSNATSPPPPNASTSPEPSAPGTTDVTPSINVFTFLDEKTPAPDPETTPSPPLSTSTPVTATLDGWHVYAPPDGSFSIMMPDRPSLGSEQFETSVGPLTLHTLQTLSDNVLYTVLYSDYPSEIQRANQDELLSAGASHAIDGMGGTIISQHDFLLNGYPGKEVLASAQRSGHEMTIQGRFYMVENRLYQVIAAWLTDDAPRTEVDQFLDSLTLLSPARTTPATSESLTQTNDLSPTTPITATPPLPQGQE